MYETVSLMQKSCKTAISRILHTSEQHIKCEVLKSLMQKSEKNSILTDTTYIIAVENI
jgi:hypothetical protein